MRKYPLLWPALLLALAACTAAPAHEITPTAVPATINAAPQAAATPAVLAAPPTATVVPSTATTVEVAAAEAASPVGHPDQRTAPAPPGEYVEDVGATGRPQLLEFFTDW